MAAQPTPAPARPATGGAAGYDVARPLGKCAVTGRQIEPDEKFHAALKETSLGFERHDVSDAAWNDYPKDGLVASWHTVMPRPEARKKLFVDDEVLVELFERLADTTEPAKLNFRFVLGLILMRKRLLVYENTRVDGDKEYWTVRRRRADAPLDLLNPKLNEEQITEVSQQLSQVLHEEL